MFRKLKNWSWCVLLLTAAVVGCGGGESVSVPSTPDGTVEAIAKSMADYKPQVAWSALPAKYQADVKELIQIFATNMDKEVYDKGIAIVDKLAGTVKSKKEFIKNSQVIKEGLTQANINLDDFNAQLESVATMIETITKSELGSIEKMKTMDPEKFLATTGSKLMKNGVEVGKVFDKEGKVSSVEKGKDTKVTVIESKDGVAKVKVEVPGADPKEEILVQVDGKWVPQHMARDWDKKIAEAKENLAKVKVTSDNKTQSLAAIGMIDGVLSGLADAKTQEDFDKAVMGLMMMAPGMGGPPSGGPPAGFAPPPEN